MTKEDFLKELNFFTNNINVITKIYLLCNSPFKVGDIIITEDNEVGKIKEFIHVGDGCISAYWKILNPDGTVRDNVSYLPFYKLCKSRLYTKQEKENLLK